MKQWLFAVCLICAIMAPSVAQSADLSNYGTLKLGYFIPNNDGDGLKDYENSGSFGLALGHVFTTSIAGEIGWEYYTTKEDYSETGNVSVNGASPIFGAWSSENRIMVWSLPITAKYLIKAPKDVILYVGAGVGLYFTRLEIENRTLTSGDTRYLYDDLSDSGRCWGYHFVAGADVYINPAITLGGELKWNKAQQGIEDSDRINIGGSTFNLVAKHYF